MNNWMPEYKKSAFSCPHCGVYASQEFYELRYYAGSPSSMRNSGVVISICSHCNEEMFWLEHRGELNNITHAEILYPLTLQVPPPAKDTPEDIKQDYLEAAKILSASPRGAAALLRLAIQKLMKTLGEEGKNINDDIASLVSKGKVDEHIQQALDTVRVIGNNAVHPGEFDLNDNAEIAKSLFDIFNYIVEQTVSREKRIRELYDSLPLKSHDAMKKRDSK